jgi:hypothetical protein
VALDERAGALAEESRGGRVEDTCLVAWPSIWRFSARIEAPAWADGPSRFLQEPFFADGLESLKATPLVERPLAFSRRLIFISADALSRRVRAFAAS